MTDDAHLTGQSPTRTIEGGIFPFSARANVREGIFSDVLATVLQCNPSIAIDGEFKSRFLEMDVEGLELSDGIDPHTVWEVFEEKYTTTSSGDNLVAVPFNSEIAKRVRPKFSNQWGTWYRLHLTTVTEEGLEFDDDLHQRFRARLEDLNPANIFEQAVVAVAESFEEPRNDPDASLQPLRPYVERVTTNFGRDLDAWLENDVESSSDWLRGAQDLIGIHFFMYYIQVSVNLRKEWKHFTDLDSDEKYEPTVHPIPFGIESEPASLDRPFVHAWEGGQGMGYSIERDIYHSWGRLAVLRILNRALGEHGAGPEYPVMLTEARHWMDDAVRETAIKTVYDHLPGADVPSTSSHEELVDAAERLFVAIDNYYRFDVNDVAPISMGVRGVKRLADADVRFLTRSRGRPGYRFQMADETMAFLARVFASSPLREDNKQTFQDFVKYLERRGFKLDPQSQTAARSSLESMGLLEQESDSGESVNVRTY